MTPWRRWNRWRPDLPAGIGYEWTGLSFQERQSGNQAPLLYALSLLVVFLSLAALYESWSIPFAVMLVVPLGIIGAVLGAALRGLENDVFFQVGLLTTIGLSAKNAILIAEFAKDLEDQGRALLDATLEATRMRLRPILMTSLAFGLGVTPLMLSSGAGSGAAQRDRYRRVRRHHRRHGAGDLLYPAVLRGGAQIVRRAADRQETRFEQRPMNGGARMNRKALTALLATLAVAGCTLAPDYQQPEPPVPASAGDDGRIAERPGAAGLGSPVPGPAAAASIDPHRAEQQPGPASGLAGRGRGPRPVPASRARRCSPELSVDGDGTRQRQPADLSQTGDSDIQTQYSVGLGVAAYEVDLLGRLRSLKQSALQQYLATEEARPQRPHHAGVGGGERLPDTAGGPPQSAYQQGNRGEAQQESVDLAKGRFDLGPGSGTGSAPGPEVALETARANQARFKRLVASGP